MRPVVIIPAPTGSVSPNVTGFAIGVLGVVTAFGGPVALIWLARLNGFV